jgi:hypothetical protein
MILVGFFEAFGSAWAYDILGQFERQTKPVVLSFMTANFGAVILGCGLWFGIDGKSAVWAGFVGFFIWYFMFLGVTHFFIKKALSSTTDGSRSSVSVKSMWWDVYFGNIVALRDRISKKIGRVPFVWCLLMRHFIPHVLIILFVNLAQSKRIVDITLGNGEVVQEESPLLGNYEGYLKWPYQTLGILIVALTIVIFLIGVFLPNLYAPLALPQNKEAQMELNRAKGLNDDDVEEEEEEHHESNDNDKNTNGNIKTDDGEKEKALSENGSVEESVELDM